MHNRIDTITESSSMKDSWSLARKGPSGSIKLLLDLVLKLNEAFVQARDLDDILNAVLAGTTSGEGLGFNRAFLFLLDDHEEILQGHFGLGPRSPEEAGRIWNEIVREQMSLFEILAGVRDQLMDEDHPVNKLVKSIEISMSDKSNVLVRALDENRAFLVTRDPKPDAVLSPQMCDRLGTDEFAVAPLFSHGESYGVVVADNLYSNNGISHELLYSLHLFTGLASLAICQSNMYRTLENRMEKLRQVNKAVEKQKHLLVETEKFSAIGRMLDRLLHEIRNPLSAIGGISRVLRRKESDQAKIAYLDAIIKETDKIEKTLIHIAELQDTGLVSLEMVDLVSVVDLIAVMMKSDLEEVGIALHQNYPSEEIIIKADRERLSQAILYIIKNSLEAMPDGGILVIALAKKGSDVELRISDSGLGIARGHFKKVDNPFFTTKLNALGLGLSKAKQIIQLHGGVLSLSTNRIGGTTCVITLPRVIPNPFQDKK